MKIHKKLYKAGKLWITATLFSLVGIALTTTSVNADTNKPDSNQQSLTVNTSNASNSLSTFLNQADYQSTDNNIQNLQNNVNNAQQEVNQANQNVNDAQQEVNQANQDVNDAQNNVNYQQSVVNNDQTNLKDAQNAYQDAGGQSTVHESISLNSDWINAIKNYLATNSEVEQVSPDSTFGQELSNYGAVLRAQNNYVNDPALQNITVNLTSNGNLDSNTELEITRFTISLLNPIRAALGVDPYQITQRALNDSANIAAQYSAANWTIFNHGTHDFAVLNANNFDGESLSDGYLSFNNGSTTLDNIHEAIYNSIIDMLFQDGDSYWGHMTDLAGLRGDLNGIYLGVQIDKNGQVHFNGNIVKKPGWTYSAPDASGNFVENTASADTSARIPLTADTSSQLQQLRENIQEYQSKLEQDSSILNNYQQNLTDANLQLQQAQQNLTNANSKLQQAQQNLTDANSKLQQAQQNLINNKQSVTGWQKVNNSWYYFDNNGNALINTWLKNNNNWFWFDNNGIMLANSWKQLYGNWYYFNQFGYMLHNAWQKAGDNWFWFDNNGIMLANSWKQLYGNWYYFNQFGYMLHNAWQKAGDNWFWFDNNGIMLANSWKQLYGNWYYFNQFGYMLHNAWQKVGDNWFWFDNNGVMLANSWKQLYGNWYYFNQFGYMIHNAWQKVSDNWFWFDNNGVMLANSWKQLYGNWYYFNQFGYMIHNAWQKVSDNWFWFDNNGVMLANSWKQLYGNWYYFNQFGYMLHNAWKYINNKWYRFNGDGIMLSDYLEFESDGKPYYFASDGAWDSSIVIPESISREILKNGDYIIKKTASYGDYLSAETDEHFSHDGKWQYTYSTSLKIFKNK